VADDDEEEEEAPEFNFLDLRGSVIAGGFFLFKLLVILLFLATS
jgi:hypothetical protein